MSYRPPSGRAGQDRWLISYADLVTLLLACFATAYAASVARSAEASSAPAAAAPVQTIPVPEAPAPPREPVAKTPRPSLRERLAPALADGLDEFDIEIVEDARGLVISLPDSATFSSGRADLTTAAQALLRRMADALRTTDARIRIEGHTDDAAILGGRYRSNWELSTARASAVVVFLITETGFAPGQLSAAGYGEFHPRAANDRPEGRALNRRVDIVVIESGDEVVSMPATSTP